MGEHEVNHVLTRLEQRDQMIVDEVVNICVNYLQINKEFLFIKKNRQKHDCMIAVVYLLQKNNIKPAAIFYYFRDKNMKINEMYMKALNLSPVIIPENKLKSDLLILEEKTKPVFDKYKS
ncbi:MAG: hypothetical protein PHX80_04625 [Candidatus Nanoarchaeia archaeon]|nr:hypothetical protein [Candidatus Nanoarchaeia archaeon]